MKKILITASAVVAVATGIIIKTGNNVQYTPNLQSNAVVDTAELNPATPVTPVQTSIDQPVIEPAPVQSVVTPSAPITPAPSIKEQTKANTIWSASEWDCYDKIVESKYTWSNVTQAQLNALDVRVKRTYTPCGLARTLLQNPEYLNDL